MRVLDLFCGGGGAARGYYAAGASVVVGIDIADHGSSYPGVFAKCDALEFLREHGHRFDFIHASPPCQGYSRHVSSSSSPWVGYSKGKDEPQLIDKTRELLVASGTPYVIENVVGARAHMINPITLCGTMFGLPTSRHRLIESSFGLTAPVHGKCAGVAKEYAAKMGWEYRDMSVTGKGRRAGTSERWKQILGVEGHMTQSELAESIPPAYAEYILRQFVQQLLKSA